MKKILALALALCMVFALCACGQQAAPAAAPAEAPAAAPAEEAPAAEAEPVKVGLILDTGGLGDKNFNDMAFEGINAAADDLGIEFDYIETQAAADYVPNLRMMCETEEYDLIVVLGSSQGDAITEVSADFPDQKISHIDSTLELPNVSAINTKWQEQTFIAGVVAGLGTLSDMPFANPENVIGIVLGQENPSLNKGVVGYKAGAMYVNPDVEVLYANLNSFSDAGLGKETAISMFNQGADFIQAVAGGAGMGIYNASGENGFYSFGVGANVNYLQPDNMPGTSSRTVNLMVYKEVKDLLDGTWTPGLHISGIKEDAVGYDATQSNVVLPDDIQAAVDEIMAGLKAGTIVPPESEEEIEAWVAANQYAK